jgi:hypothetical protein
MTATIADPIALPILDQRYNRGMTSATSWCGTDSYDATRERTTDIEPPKPIRIIARTIAAVLDVALLSSSIMPMPMIFDQEACYLDCFVAVCPAL